MTLAGERQSERHGFSQRYAKIHGTLVVLCAAAALIWLTPETVLHPNPSRVGFRPKLSLPRGIRAQFVAPALTGFGLMAMVGFYAAPIPGILSHDLNIKSHAGRRAVFLLAPVVAALGSRRIESNIISAHATASFG